MGWLWMEVILHSDEGGKGWKGGSGRVSGVKGLGSHPLCDARVAAVKTYTLVHATG